MVFGSQAESRVFGIALLALGVALALGLCACDGGQARSSSTQSDEAPVNAVVDVPASSSTADDAVGPEDGEAAGESQGQVPAAEPAVASTEAARAALALSEDYRQSFVHGEKSAACQKYIVLHDTESESDAWGVIDYWDGAGTGVAAHFVVNKDGTVVQCVPLDQIAHHAGFGDTGHNALYGVEDESRDDKAGTTPIGDWAADYGMNSYSIGIEMVHVGGSGYYPEEQLAAVDALIAYIDAYYGFPSAIIDHKAWRTGNSDTSPEFAPYLANYQDHRTHA